MAKRPVRKPAAARKTSATKQKTARPRAAKKGESTRELSEAAKARRERSQRALQLYERGIEAMQRRDFAAADTTLREVVTGYPEEREFHERAHLYLRICERESAPPAPPPQSLEERTYAATLALNSGSLDEALRHLDAAAHEDPKNDHVQYMMAVARTLRGETDPAMAHLRRAIELNADNRLLAQQEPDFAVLHDDDAFLRAIEPPPSAVASRRRLRIR